MTAAARTTSDATITKSHCRPCSNFKSLRNTVSIIAVGRGRRGPQGRLSSGCDAVGARRVWRAVPAQLDAGGCCEGAGRLVRNVAEPVRCRRRSGLWSLPRQARAIQAPGWRPCRGDIGQRAFGRPFGFVRYSRLATDQVVDTDPAAAPHRVRGARLKHPGDVLSAVPLPATSDLKQPNSRQQGRRRRLPLDRYSRYRAGFETVQLRLQIPALCGSFGFFVDLDA